MSELSEYLGEVAGRPCGYGRLDCAILMADWVMRRGWPDPMPDRRGTYASEREYRAAIRSEGGLVASCGRRFARCGLVPTAAPDEGDVALVLAPIAKGRAIPAGGIVMASGLVALLDWPRGIVGARLPVVAAWGIGHG